MFPLPLTKIWDLAFLIRALNEVLRKGPHFPSIEDLGITRFLFVHCAKFYKKARICPPAHTEVLRVARSGLPTLPLQLQDPLPLRGSKQSLTVNIHMVVQKTFVFLSHFEAFHDNQIIKTVYTCTCTCIEKYDMYWIITNILCLCKYVKSLLSPILGTTRRNIKSKVCKQLNLL